MTRKNLSHKDEERIREMLANVELPLGVTDVCMAVEHTPGSKIAGTDLWSGLGGHTRYGPAFVINGRETTAPVALFDTQLEARYAYALLAGEEGELWARKEARRARIAEIEAAEAAAAEEAKATAKELKRLAKKGVDLAEATGGGSSRRSRSSEKRSASSGARMRVDETMSSQRA